MPNNFHKKISAIVVNKISLKFNLQYKLGTGCCKKCFLLQEE